MKRFASSLAVGALALGALGLVSGPASAATTTLTLTQPTTTAVNGASFTLSATASEAGSVAFTANSTPIPGCALEVAAAPSFVATCPWTPTLAMTSPVTIGATFTPTLATDSDSTATPVNVNTDAVTLAGAAVYLGQNAKLTATTYSAGAVAFSENSTPLTGCASVNNALNGNETAYVASCTITAPSSGGTITATYTPNNGSYASGSATYALVVNTVVLSGGAGAVVGAPTTITADASEAGTAAFSTDVSSVLTPISGCSSVATVSTAAPYVFTCAYSPSAVGTSNVEATITPASGPTETSTDWVVTASDIVLSGGSAIYGVSTGTIVASTYTSGTVTFGTVADSITTAISGCSNVATIGSAAPYVALCTWTPSASGATVLSATLTPTTGSAVTSSPFTVTVGTPIQGQEYPISMYVDTIIGSGASGTGSSPVIGSGCEISNEFIVGQTIVFRVYGNDAELNGAPLTSVNVSSATVTIAGYAGSPITMSYASHGTEAFWTGALATGTKSGQYDTLGIIPYTVTIHTDAIPAVPAVTKSVKEYKKEWVYVRVGKKIKKELRRVFVGYETVIVTPAVAAIPGATGTFNSAFNPSSQATLNAVPTV